MVGGERGRNRVSKRMDPGHGQTSQIPDSENTLGFQTLGVYLERIICLILCPFLSIYFDGF